MQCYRRSTVQTCYRRSTVQTCQQSPVGTVVASVAANIKHSLAVNTCSVSSPYFVPQIYPFHYSLFSLFLWIMQDALHFQIRTGVRTPKIYTFHLVTTHELELSNTTSIPNSVKKTRCCWSYNSSSAVDIDITSTYYRLHPKSKASNTNCKLK